MNMKKFSLHPQHILVIGFLILSFLFLGGVVFGVGRSDAVGGNPTNYGNSTTSGHPSATSGGRTTQFGRPSGTPGRQGLNRLTEARLRACQARENTITQRTTHLLNLVTTMESKFDSIAKAVEDYYITKVVSSGKTVATYDSLIADIQTKNTAVQTAVTAAQTDGAGFTCTGDDPKGQLIQFRTDMLVVINALQDYRISIKNLIVAVRSVTGTTEEANPGTSGKPSTTPRSSETGSQGGNQ